MRHTELVQNRNHNFHLQTPVYCMFGILCYLVNSECHFLFQCAGSDAWTYVTASTGEQTSDGEKMKNHLHDPPSIEKPRKDAKYYGNKLL